MNNKPVFYDTPVCLTTFQWMKQFRRLRNGSFGSSPPPRRVCRRGSFDREDALENISVSGQHSPNWKDVAEIVHREAGKKIDISFIISPLKRGTLAGNKAELLPAVGVEDVGFEKFGGLTHEKFPGFNSIK